MRSLYFLSIVLFAWTHAAAQKQFVLNSEYLNKPDTAWVFTPANYDGSSDKQFPVVYLLHGWSGNYQQWDEIMDCQAYASNYGCIIVCPDGLYDSWYINSPVDSENRYEDFFLRDLMPLISKNYRIQQKNVFITGLSMGGHGALYLFAQNPSLFKSAGSLSGLLDLNLWREHYGIARVLGLRGTNYDDEVLSAYSVAGNIDKIKSAEKKFILSCGTEDPFYLMNIDFVDACEKNHVNLYFIESPGGHNTAYWRSAIDEHFDFFTRSIATK